MRRLDFLRFRSAGLRCCGTSGCWPSSDRADRLLLFGSVLTTAGRDSPVVRVRVVELGVLPGGSFFLVHHVLDFQELLFGPTPLPAILPVTDKEVEAKGVDLHARLETDAQIAVVHLVLVDVRMEEVEMAGYGEKEIVVIGG